MEPLPAIQREDYKEYLRQQGILYEFWFSGSKININFKWTINSSWQMSTTVKMNRRKQIFTYNASKPCWLN